MYFVTIFVMFVLTDYQGLCFNSSVLLQVG